MNFQLLFSARHFSPRIRNSVFAAAVFSLVSCGSQEESRNNYSVAAKSKDSESISEMANDSPEKNFEFPFGGNTLSREQVASYLRDAGFPEKSIGTLVCISKYESSYNPGAINRNSNGTADYGLFQINLYYWGKACGVSSNELLNPAINARCALRVYRQQGYEAWYGYRNNRSECNSTPAPGGGGGGDNKPNPNPRNTIKTGNNKLYSGPSLTTAFCSNIKAGTPVTIEASNSRAHYITLQSGACRDYQGNAQTKGWMLKSAIH